MWSKFNKSDTYISRNGGLVCDTGLVVGAGSVRYPVFLSVMEKRKAADYIYFVDAENKYKD